MLWFYLHFPNLQLDHYARDQEQIPPLALVEGHPPRIESANSQARAQGIRPGQTLSTASCLAVNLQVRHADRDLQFRLLQQLAQWCYQWASPVSLWIPDGLLLEVSGMRRLHGGIDRLWAYFERGLAKLGFQVQPALGLSPRMARQLARAGTGLCCENPERLRKQLDALPISQAGLPEQASERLQRMGLQTVGGILSLPARELARRLGPESIDQLRRLTGQIPDPQSQWSPPPRLSRRSDFIQEAEQISTLLFPLQRILEELAEYLRWRQQATDTLCLNLYHRDQSIDSLRIRTTAPEHRQSELMQLCRLHLESYQLSAPVTALELRVERFLERTADATDFFETPSSRAGSFNALVSRLQARLGEAAIRFIQPCDDHRPEKGQQAAGRRPPGFVQGAWVGPAPKRPFWLLRSPRPLLESPVHWLDGPERIDAGWWDGEPVQRDYYVAELSDHRLAWLFRNSSGVWYIHGWFG